LVVHSLPVSWTIAIGVAASHSRFAKIPPHMFENVSTDLGSSRRLMFETTEIATNLEEMDSISSIERAPSQKLEDSGCRIVLCPATHPIHRRPGFGKCWGGGGAGPLRDD
jgi:hypothetical protein